MTEKPEKTTAQIIYQDDLKNFLASEKYLENMEFVELSFKSIKRKGIVKLLAFLKDTDYYESPASTRFHNNDFGGLIDHSIDVTKRFNRLCERDYPIFPRASRIICGLLHDVCKLGTYFPAFNKNGSRSKTPYKTENQLPIGHGEKSIIMLQQIPFELTLQEMLVIRWHMGLYDYSWKGVEDKVTKIEPAVKLFSSCDMISSVIGGIENGDT